MLVASSHVDNNTSDQRPETEDHSGRIVQRPYFSVLMNWMIDST
jgi:hypothetical protein